MSEETKPRDRRDRIWTILTGLGMGWDDHVRYYDAIQDVIAAERRQAKREERERLLAAIRNLDFAAFVRAALPDDDGAQAIIHGKTCEKAPHRGSGYLHGEDDDSPFDDDGVKYCGRCHVYVP